MARIPYTKMSVTLNGEPVEVCKIDHDVNGNSRYVVHFLSLGVKPGDYQKAIPGLSRYRAKWYGGGYVFQSVNLKMDLAWMQEQVAKYYGA